MPDAALEANPCPQPARVHTAMGRGVRRWESNLDLIVEKLAFFLDRRSDRIFDFLL